MTIKKQTDRQTDRHMCSVNNLRAWNAYFTPSAFNEVSLLRQTLNLSLEVSKPNEPVTLRIVRNTITLHLQNTSNYTE